MKRMFPILLLFILHSGFAQSELPAVYFDDPLDVPLVLSGTFGELRSNHFHGGLDIKTQQREGLPVYASAEGYISRINISSYGYGKALYIQHPNGLTTVYAHLREFSPEIQEYIKKKQYLRESYEIETFPTAEELKISRGQMIAYSGNTGGSGGPHLHFEIRDEQQRPMNPLLYGFEIKDSRAPIVNSVFVYPVDQEAHVNQSAQRQKLHLSLQSDGSYRAEKIEACGQIGFGVSTVDQQDEAPNKNGVFRIESLVNGQKIFQANFEQFSFAESRHINQLIDYGYYAKNQNRIQKLFVEQSNPLSIYSNLVDQGIVNIKEDHTYDYTIVVTDFAGNERSIHIPVEGSLAGEDVSREDHTTDYFVRASKEAVFEANGIDIHIPRNSLYKDTFLDISFDQEKVSLHEDVIPLHQNISIGFDVSKYPPEEREQMYIARLSPNGSPYYSSTQKKGDRFITRTRTLGEFTLARDTHPPRIVPVNFRNQQWLSNHKQLKVKISDNETGIKEFKGTINGHFILMEYEYKKNLLTYDFDDNIISDTENNLKVIVTDNVGNTSTFESTFYRK